MLSLRPIQRAGCVQYTNTIAMWRKTLHTSSRVRSAAHFSICEKKNLVFVGVDSNVSPFRLLWLFSNVKLEPIKLHSTFLYFVSVLFTVDHGLHPIEGWTQRNVLKKCPAKIHVSLCEWSQANDERDEINAQSWLRQLLAHHAKANFTFFHTTSVMLYGGFWGIAQLTHIRRRTYDSCSLRWEKCLPILCVRRIQVDEMYRNRSVNVWISAEKKSSKYLSMAKQSERKQNNFTVFVWISFFYAIFRSLKVIESSSH